MPYVQRDSTGQVVAIFAQIDRGLLRLTDLPPDAQRKLLARKGARARLREGLDLLSPNGVI